MEGNEATRRGFFGTLAAWAGALALVPAAAQPALAGNSRRRRGGWGYGGGWGYRGSRGRRVSSRRRRFYGGSPYYNNRGYYGGGFYDRGYHGAPYVPYPQPVPFYNRGYYGPLMKREGPASVLDPLALLEC